MFVSHLWGVMGSEGEKAGTKEEMKRLTPRQSLAAVLLIGGRSVAKTARDMGLARSTVQRWKREPAFIAELARRCEQLVPKSLANPPNPPPSRPPMDPKWLAERAAREEEFFKKLLS